MIVELVPNNTTRVELVIRRPKGGVETEVATGLSVTVRLVATETAAAALDPLLEYTAVEYDDTPGEYYADILGATLASLVASEVLAYQRYYLQVLVGSTVLAVAPAHLRRVRRLSVTTT